MSDHFHIELALVRMAVAFFNRHKDDEGLNACVWQVRRLEKAHRESGQIDKADKLARILKWHDDGGIVVPLQITR